MAANPPKVIPVLELVHEAPLLLLLKSPLEAAPA
jgi:hypothetical protein